MKVKLAPVGGGRGGDAKMVSHYREEGEGGRKPAGRWEPGRRRHQAPGYKRATKKAAGPFQGAGMGNKPQVAQDREGLGGTQRFPTPTSSFEMETGSSSRSALPGHGVGGGGQAGRQTKCHQPGHGGCQPTISTPPAPAQSPYAWSFESGKRWGPSRNRGSSRQSQVSPSRGSSPRPYKDGAAWHCQGDGLW